MTEHVDERDPEDGPVLSEQLVGQHGAEDGEDVAEAGERVVDDGRGVLGEVELLREVEREDRLHAIVGEALAKLVADDEHQRLGKGKLLKDTRTGIRKLVKS